MCVLADLTVMPQATRASGPVAVARDLNNTRRARSASRRRYT